MCSQIFWHSFWRNIWKSYFLRSLLGKGAAKIRGRQVLYQFILSLWPWNVFETSIKGIQVFWWVLGREKIFIISSWSWRLTWSKKPLQSDLLGCSSVQLYFWSWSISNSDQWIAREKGEKSEHLGSNKNWAQFLVQVLEKYYVTK